MASSAATPRGLLADKGYRALDIKTWPGEADGMEGAFPDRNRLAHMREVIHVLVRHDFRTRYKHTSVAGTKGRFNGRVSLPKQGRSRRTHEHAPVCPPCR